MSTAERFGNLQKNGGKILIEFALMIMVVYHCEIIRIFQSHKI
jgi:hypothetical protein